MADEQQPDGSVNHYDKGKYGDILNTVTLPDGRSVGWESREFWDSVKKNAREREQQQQTAAAIKQVDDWYDKTVAEGNAHPPSPSHQPRSGNRKTLSTTHAAVSDIQRDTDTLQKKLKTQGLYATGIGKDNFGVDGDYGGQTNRATYELIEKAQEKSGLKPDGHYNAESRKAMKEMGVSEEALNAIDRLNAKGLYKPDAGMEAAKQMHHHAGQEQPTTTAASNAHTGDTKGHPIKPRTMTIDV